MQNLLSDSTYNIIFDIDTFIGLFLNFILTGFTLGPINQWRMKH